MKYVKWKVDEFTRQLGITDLPVDVLNLEYHEKGLDVLLLPYADSDALNIIEGYNLQHHIRMYKALTTVTQSRKTVILYNNRLSYGERNYVLAHELGHIVLSHTSRGGILGKSTHISTANRQEQEADAFARYLLAPIETLQKEKNLNATGISERTTLPYEIAAIVWSELEQENIQVRKRQTLKHWKTASVTFALLLAFEGTGVLVHDQLDRNAVEQIEAEIKAKTVYATESGERYHEQDCQYVEGKENLREMTLEEAEEMNLLPCEGCEPDEIQQ